MGLFGKLFKGPEVDQEKSENNKKKMRALFDQVVENGAQYKLLACYTEDVRRFNYGLVHGSKSTIASLIVGWKEEDPTVVILPTVGSSSFHPTIRLEGGGSNCGHPSHCAGLVRLR